MDSCITSDSEMNTVIPLYYCDLENRITFFSFAITISSDR